VDAALAAAGLTVHSVQLPGWAASFDAFSPLLLAEFWATNQQLLDAEGLGPAANRALQRGRAVDALELAAARAGQRAWRDEVLAALAGVPVLALPTLIGPPPTLDAVRGFDPTALTAPFNLAGLPALALPVPGGSLQLVAGPGGEELLCATAAAVEVRISPARPAPPSLG
jgi:amidase